MAAGDTLKVPPQMESWVAADPSPAAATIQPAENKTATAAATA